MKPNPDFVSKVEQDFPEKDQQLVLVSIPDGDEQRDVSRLLPTCLPAAGSSMSHV